jgi:hypothetical protein
MAVNMILPPYPIFSEANGQPLEAGYIYIGQPGLEARSSPKESFFDEDKTIPTGTASGAAVRTMAGYPVRNGSPAAIYTEEDFSITVTDRNGVVVYTALNRTFQYSTGNSGTSILAPDGSLAAPGFAFVNETNSGILRAGAGAIQQSVLGVLTHEMTATLAKYNIPLALATNPTMVAGTNAQGQGPITADQNVVITAAANPSGATLPAATVGRRVMIVNRGGNPVNVYPASGAAIADLATNAPMSLPVGASAVFIARSATQWEGQVNQAYDADLAQIAALADPGADRGLFWDYSAGAYAFLEFGVGLTLIGTTLTAGWTFSASTATTSGSSVTITGVPSNATEIEVYFHGVSMTVADPMNVQLTVGGSAVTSGYDSSASSSGANSNSTTGFVVRYTSSGEDVRGIMRLVKTDTGTWASSHGVKSSGNTSAGGGDVTGVGTVDGIRLTRIGTANFDAGSFRIAWR